MSASFLAIIQRASGGSKCAFGIKMRLRDPYVKRAKGRALHVHSARSTAALTYVRAPLVMTSCTHVSKGPAHIPGSVLNLQCNSRKAYVITRGLVDARV